MKKRVVVTAYAVHPKRGSEDGTGWNIIRTLGQQHELIAITRKNNQPAIDEYRTHHPAELNNIEFHYYDLPRWLSWWKRGSRGALLYHYLWHLGVALFIIRQQFEFDLAHHLNFHCDWAPTFLWLTGKPVVWGPVGHHPRFPKNYTVPLGFSFRIKEELKWLAKQAAWRLDPFLWLSKRTSAAILGINSSVASVLRLAPDRVHIVPAVAAKAVPAPTSERQGFQVLSIGRFVPLKGFDMCIRAYAKFFHQLNPIEQQQTQLKLIGKGPQEDHLKQLIVEEKLPDGAVKIINWVPQQELANHYAKASLLFFPSHEGAGMVVPEAMAYGVPTLSYDNYGPGETAGAAGMRIPYSNYEESISTFALSLMELFYHKELRDQLSHQARQRFAATFTWEAKANTIAGIYEKVMPQNKATTQQTLERIAI